MAEFMHELVCRTCPNDTPTVLKLVKALRRFHDTPNVERALQIIINELKRMRTKIFTERLDECGMFFFEI